MSLRSAISVWVALAVVGWAGIVVSAYSLVRVDTYTVAIQKLDRDAELAVGASSTSTETAESAEAELTRALDAAPAAGR